MNFKAFPLYSTLIKSVKEDVKELAADQKACLLANIKKIDIQESEYIYALIVSYYIDTIGCNAENIPYDGKSLKSGIKINLERLPFRLQHLLYLFIQKHLDKEREESEREMKTLKKRVKRTLNI
jgi:hypothetical protein